MVKKIAIMQEKFSFQKPIISISNEGVATKGNRYIVGFNPTGIFSTFTPKNIVWYDGSAWNVVVPSEGWEVYNLDTKKKFVYTDNEWVEETEVDISGKMDKVEGSGIEGNLVSLDSEGNAQNSGVSATDVTNAVSNSHVQNTDTYLNFGGTNQVSASQAKEAYNTRAQYDDDLGIIYFNFSD